MTHEREPEKPLSSPLHIRADIIKALRDQPFATFETVYDQLKATSTEAVLQLLGDALYYSDNTNEQQAFAAGVLHTLDVQLASHEVEHLEAIFDRHHHTSVDVDGEDQPHSSEPGDDRPAA